MADDSFNGATLTLATVAIGPLLSINVTDTAPKADCTSADDSARHFKGGVPELTVTCEVVGGVTAAVGDEGDLDVAWGDIGTSTLGSIAACEITSVSTSGSMDDKITSTVEFHTAALTA